MRWYVEVSRVGESGVADEYCVEAKQWQAALQEARKLRGDSGALSKFSIELLDRGYRAVDPSLKLRYLINEAPSDAKLSQDAGKPPKGEPVSVKPKAPESLAPTPFLNSVATASPVVGAVPRPTSHPAPRPNSVAPARASSLAPRPHSLLVPDDSVPPPPVSPEGAAPQLAQSAPPLPESTSLKESHRPTVPVFELVRQRAEDPRPESPITYREFAYAVQPGASRAELEALLQDRYRVARAAIEEHPPGKFVQLAIFDHVFKRKPERAPLATFVWKDWRGDPVVAFPAFGDTPIGPLSQVPPARESVVPPNGAASSLAPGPNHSVLPVPPSVLPPPATASSATPPAAASVIPDSKPLVPMRVVVLESRPAPAQVRTEPPPVVAAIEPAPAPEVSVSESVEEPVSSPASLEISITEEPLPLVRRVDDGVSTEGAAAIEIPITEEPLALVRRADDAPVPTREPTPVAAPAAHAFELHFESSPLHGTPAAARSEQKSSPGGARASRPRIAFARRRAGEDLIGELFELMHELHFMPDVAAGADFVLSVLDEVLPCEGALIHVFDIDTGHFVVVRAKGPNAGAALLQRMPDHDPLVLSVMRGPHALSVDEARTDPRFTGSRWQSVGVVPERALCGAVQHGGRYLGLIELANPQGNTPFHRTEINALDYICQQFADFLSQKPIVLSPDVILART